MVTWICCNPYIYIYMSLMNNFSTCYISTVAKYSSRSISCKHIRSFSTDQSLCFHNTFLLNAYTFCPLTKQYVSYSPMPFTQLSRIFIPTVFLHLHVLFSLPFSQVHWLFSFLNLCFTNLLYFCIENISF